MKTRPILTLCLISLYSFSSFAQLEADYWMFTNNAYVRFRHGSSPDTAGYPIFQTGLFNKGAVSYSDQNGNLLFYGSGGVLFDRNFRPFPSLDLARPPGSPLASVVSNGTASQPMIAIPYPNHDSLYFIFHIGSDNGYHSQLYYSIVNMNLRGGLGEIQPRQRDIPIFKGVDVCFKLTAVLHCNKKDVWIIGHLANSDQYFSLLVSPSGIPATPVYFQGNFIPNKSRNGCVKVSALGNRLAAAYQDTTFIELMDFNSATGTGSNLKILTADPALSDIDFDPHFSGFGPMGVDFSPSGSKLYVTSTYLLKLALGGEHCGFVYQFDASLPTTSEIQASQFRLDSVYQQVSGAIQIGNNGKMYVNISDNLSEIASPENSGFACGYTSYLLRIGGSNFNLPVFLQSYFRYPVITTNNCEFQNISFSIDHPVGISSMTWDFGDPASGTNNASSSFTPTHIFSSESAYKVRAMLVNANGCGVDTINKIIYSGRFKVFLGNDTTICEGDTLLLKIKIPGGWNSWSDRSGDTVMKVTQPGKYWVRVDLGECNAFDTIEVKVRSVPKFSLGNDTTICNNDKLTLKAENNAIFPSYLWSTGETGSDITVNNKGMYSLKISDDLNCHYSDSITVNYKSLPDFSLGNDTSLCEADLELNAAVSGATKYRWSTGETVSTIQVNRSNIYWAEVTKDNCLYRDSINVRFTDYPVVRLGADTTLCENSTLLLNAQNDGASFLWQDHSADQMYIVKRAGVYFVTVTNGGCPTSDTIQILYNTKPEFSLGPDVSICSGQVVILKPSIQSGQSLSYLWQDGSRNTTYDVRVPGLYSVLLVNQCGTSSDSIFAFKRTCQLYVPNAFTPNGDGLNDLFKARFDGGIANFKMEVYNRWGEKVFETNDIKRGWNGIFHEKVLPGAYVWVLRYSTAMLNDQVEKGTVLLIK
jgi:gliding motility-associated-like protein